MTHVVDEDEAPSEAVVRAVAALTNQSPLELDPLFDVVDPDYLDRVIGAGDDGVRAELCFTFASCEVTVTETHVHATWTPTDG